MEGVITFADSILLYGTLLTNIFQHFGLNLDYETDMHVCQYSDVIDNGSINRMGYEEVNNKQVLKTSCAPAIDDDESDKDCYGYFASLAY